MLSRRTNLVVLSLGLLLFIHPPAAMAIDRDATEAFQAMAAAGIEFLNDPAECPGVISAQNLNDNLNEFTVIDIRSRTAYESGHIYGAFHSSMSTLIDDLDTFIPSGKPYVIAGYTGQVGTQVKLAMALLGFNDVYSLLFGMSSWSPTLDTWTPNCNDFLFNPETTDQNGNLTVHEFPALAGDPESIVAERVAINLAEGYKGVSYLDIQGNLEDYFIVNYFGEADYLGQGSSGVPGHIPGAFQFSPFVSMGIHQMLENIPGDMPVVVYDWTGQHSTSVVAYLNMLGYQAYSLKFGANALFHSDLTAHRWSPTAMHDFPLIAGGYPTAVPEADSSLVSYLGNFPNPFNPSTTISYRLAESLTVSLRIYDLSGQLVRTLVQGEGQSQGTHEFVWAGRNDSGQSVASGTYLYRLDAEGFMVSRRLMLLK